MNILTTLRKCVPARRKLVKYCGRVTKTPRNSTHWKRSGKIRKNCTTCASLVQWRVQYVAVRSCYLLPIISSFVCRELMLELCPCASTIFYFARFADCHFWYKLGPQRLAFTLTPDAHFQVPRRAHAYTQQPIFLRFTRHRNRICPQESRPSQMVGKRMSNCVAVKPTIAISATWLIRSWCSGGNR